MNHGITEMELCEVLINSTDEEALRELYRLRTSEWRSWTAPGTRKTGAMQDMVMRLGSRHAFDYIPYAIKLLMEQNEEDLFVTALALVSNFVKASNTTEQCRIFKNSITAISEKVEFYDNDDGRLLWKGILAWYRL